MLTFFIFTIFIYFMYVSALYVCTLACQKRASDPIIDCCESPYGCLETNSAALKEQPVLCTTEPSLQPGSLVGNACYIVFFLIMCMRVCMHISAGVHGNQKRGLDLLELELEVIASL